MTALNQKTVFVTVGTTKFDNLIRCAWGTPLLSQSCIVPGCESMNQNLLPQGRGLSDVCCGLETQGFYTLAGTKGEWDILTQRTAWSWHEHWHNSGRPVC